MKLYSFSTRGFYDPDDHGPRAVEIIDPDYVAPAGGSDAEPLLLTVPNPLTKIPADAVEISDELYQELLLQQNAGKEIQQGPDGLPRAVDRAPPSAEELRTQRQRHAEDIVRAHLLARVRSLGYDGWAEAIGYAEEPAVPKYQAECQALRRWRSLVWEWFYTEDVQALASRPLLEFSLEGAPAYVPPGHGAGQAE